MYWNWATVPMPHKYFTVDFQTVETWSFGVGVRIRRKHEDHAGVIVAIGFGPVYVEFGIVDNRHADNRKDNQ